MNGLVFALKDEMDCLLAHCEITERKRECGREILTLSYRKTKCYLAVLSGVGKVNAALATQLLIVHGATRILNFGLCGCANDSYRIGDSVAVNAAIQSDFDLSTVDDVPRGQVDGFPSPLFHADCELLKKLQNAGLPTENVSSRDSFCIDANEVKAGMQEFQCALREMELGGIAQAAMQADIPYASVKVISDVIGNDNGKSYYENKAFCLQKLTERMPLYLDLIG